MPSAWREGGGGGMSGNPIEGGGGDHMGRGTDGRLETCQLPPPKGVDFLPVRS